MAYDPNAAPKPYRAKGSRILRCPDCLLPQGYCICNYLIAQPSKFGVVLLTHHDEQFKPTNTGRLIAETLEPTWTFIWSRTEPPQELLSLLRSDMWQPYILFPADGEDYQNRVVSSFIKEAARPLLIVLDGTWRQARRMFRLSEYLKDLPILSVDISTSSMFRLREANSAHQFCTAEATAHILDRMGDPNAGRHLLSIYDVFNRHYDAARQSKPVDLSKALKSKAKEQKRF